MKTVIKNAYLASILCVVAACVLHSQAAQGVGQANQFIVQGNELLDKKRTKEALKVALEAESLEPNNPKVHRLLSLIYEQLEDFPNAIEEATKVVRLTPDSPACHFNLARIYHATGRWSQAKAEYQKALALGKRDVETQRNIAVCSYQEGDILTAIILLEKLSKEYPKDKKVWLNLAMAYYSYADTNGALYAVDKALTIDPKFYTAIFYRAQFCNTALQLGEARKLAQKLIDLEPKNPTGYLLLGRFAISANANDFLLAKSVLKQAIANIPGETEVFKWLGVHYYERGLGLTQKGKIGGLQLRNNWWQLSKEAFLQTLSASPNNQEALIGLATILSEQRLWSEALPYARKAAQLDPKYEGASILYKRCQIAQNDLINCIKQWFRHGFASTTH